MYSRRTVLALGFAFFGAGCQSAGFSGRDPDQFCIHELHARPFDPVEELPPDYSSFQRKFATRVIRNGHATAFYGPRPLKNDSYVAVEGVYYRIFHVNGRMTELPALDMTVEWEPGQTVPSDETVLSLAELPNADRMALRSAVYGGLYREQVHPQQKLDHSMSPVVYPNGTELSVLASYQSCWVRWGNRLYEVSIRGEGTSRKPVHEYAAEEAAPNSNAFRQMIADQYLVNLDDLPPEERAILEEAIEGGYYKRSQSYVPEVERLVERLRSNKSTIPELGGWFIEFEETRYILEFSGMCQGI